MRSICPPAIRIHLHLRRLPPDIHILRIRNAHIIIPPSPIHRIPRTKLPQHPALRLRRPDAELDDEVDEAVQHDAHGEDGDDGARRGAGLVAAVVEEGVHPEVVDAPGQVGEAEVEREDDDEADDVRPGEGCGAGEEQFGEGEDGVEGVLGDVGPGLELVVEGGGGVNDAPVDN